jgi:hypothetical protein
VASAQVDAMALQGVGKVRVHARLRALEAALAVRTVLTGLALSLGFGSAAPSALRADDKPVPPDVLAPLESTLALPPLPTGFVEETVGPVTWAYHESSADIARQLEAQLPRTWRELTGELGAPVSSKMTIRIARSPKEMARLAPSAAPPPAYAVGVAYPALGLVILSVVNPETWLPPDLSAVLTHELSHIALHRAVAGRPLPRWFVEGLAVRQAGEQNLARVRTLWEAAIVDEVLPLSALSANFPSRPHEVNRAYAQSADLVEHMLRNENDRARLPILLRHVAAGMAFEEAVLESYHVDLAYLDLEWRQALGERFRVLPLVLTGTALWGGIAVLAAVAFVRRRREHHAKLARWAEEEAAHERAMQALEMQRQAAVREQEARESSVVGPLSTESGVPTIEHDGQRYTLH